MSAELKDIYKFLFDFFKIYKETFGPSVSKWKLIDVNNALKWSSGIEEFYKKIKNRKIFTKFTQDIKFILLHWNLSSESYEDLLKNATKMIKKVFIC